MALKRYFAILIIISFLIVGCIPAKYIRKNTDFKRGIYITAYYVGRKSSIDSIIDFCNKNNINIIFPQVVVGGNAYYKSSLLPSGKYLQNEYAFLYLLRKAHKYNIEIHPWINANLLWSFLHSPPYDHPINKYTPILTIKLSGLNHSNLLYRWNKYRLEGLFWDPSDKNFSSYLSNIAKEISYNYNVDGIHLDFIRYPGIDYGYTQIAVKTYKKETGINILFLPLYKVFYKSTFSYDELSPYERYLYFHFFYFNKLRQKYVLKSVEKVENILPKRIKLSASVFPAPHSARMIYAQNWKEWPLDFVIPMNYTYDTDLFLQNIKYEKIDCNIPILEGLAVYWQGKDSVKITEEKIAQEENLNGIVFFDYGSLIKKDNNLPKYPYKRTKKTQKPDTIKKTCHIKIESYARNDYIKKIQYILEYIDSPLKTDTLWIIRESALYNQLDKFASDEDTLFAPPIISTANNDTFFIDCGISEQQKYAQAYLDEDTSFIHIIEPEDTIKNISLYSSFAKRKIYLYTYYKRTRELLCK